MTSVLRLRRHHRRVARRRWTVTRLTQGLRTVWQRILAGLATYFPADPPQPSPPLAKSAALREGALLSEYVDTRSNKNAA